MTTSHPSKASHKLTAFLMATAMVTAGCATTAGPASLADTAARTPELSTLTRRLNEAGLTDTLRAGGPYTVFAPTNDAFRSVPAKTLEELSRNKDALKAVLTYHVAPGAITASIVTPSQNKTVQGATVALGVAGGTVTIEDAVVVKADISAINGVIHLVDRVLMPPQR